MDLHIRVGREDDGRWFAEVGALPGLKVFGATETEALERGRVLVRILAPKTGRDPSQPGVPHEPLLSETMADIDTDAGRARVRAYLDSLPFPQYEAAPGRPSGIVVKIDADGTRTLGRLVGRKFVPAGED